MLQSLATLVLPAPLYRSFRQLPGYQQATNWTHQPKNPTQVVTSAVILAGCNPRIESCPGVEHNLRGHPQVLLYDFQDVAITLGIPWGWQVVTDGFQLMSWGSISTPWVRNTW